MQGKKNSLVNKFHKSFASKTGFSMLTAYHIHLALQLVSLLDLFYVCVVVLCSLQPTLTTHKDKNLWQNRVALCREIVLQFKYTIILIYICK